MLAMMTKSQCESTLLQEARVHWAFQKEHTLYGVIDFAQFNGQPPTVPAGRARLLLVGARHGVHCALLVSSSSGLRSQDDFEHDPQADERPWVASRLRDLQGRPWLMVDVARLLAQPSFLDAGLE